MSSKEALIYCSLFFSISVVMFFLMIKANLSVDDIQTELDQANERIEYYEEEMLEVETFTEYLEIIDQLNRTLISDGKYISFKNSEMYYYVSAETDHVSDEMFVDMWSDIDDLIEAILLYYETTDETVSLDSWVQSTYPDLYARIMEYDALYYDLK